MKKLFLAAAAAMTTTPVFAHHPLGGLPMTSFSDGVLSGVGHPLLGFDHLFFVLAVGIAAALSGRALTGAASFLVAMVAGVLLIVNGIALPFVEGAIAVSLVAIGGILAMGRKMSFVTLSVLFAVAGMFHGWAYGEALAGQEGGAAISVMLGYLIGLSVTQWALAVLAGLTVMQLVKGSEITPVQPRLAGAAVAGVGTFLLLEVLEGPALTALGLG